MLPLVGIDFPLVLWCYLFSNSKGIRPVQSSPKALFFGNPSQPGATLEKMVI